MKFFCSLYGMHIIFILSKSRTIIALGHLVMSCDLTLYTKLINILMEELENEQQGNTAATVSDRRWLNIRTYIQV